MNFISQITSIATLRAKPKYQPKRDVLGKFIQCAEGQLTELRAGADNGSWFKREGDGFAVTLRYGKRVVRVADGMDQLIVANRDAAINLLQMVIQAAKAGELDTAIEQAAKKKTA